MFKDGAPLTEDSKFSAPSPVQQEAEDAINQTNDSGIVVLPCGAGKTAVFIRQALRCKFGRVLFLTVGTLSVNQIAREISEHTTAEDYLCVYTSEKRGEPKRFVLLSCDNVLHVCGQ